MCVLEALGSGASADVAHVVGPAACGHGALKRFKADPRGEPQQEAAKLAAMAALEHRLHTLLPHPNIVACYGLVRDKGSWWACC